MIYFEIIKKKKLINYEKIKFKEQIGTGSYGVIFKGTIDNSDNEVAIKMVNQNYNEYWKSPNEIMFLVDSDHLNVVRLLGWSHDDNDHTFIILECMICSLRNFYLKLEISFEEKIKILKDIANGLI
jgi:serine/threonine protein kinase